MMSQHNTSVDGLALQNIKKYFDKTPALVDITFQVTPGEIVAVLGPSGCGKTTLLNIIAGLENPDQGEVSWQGKSLHDIPAHKRGFGLMFQDFALFPHRNVHDNVAFGLQMKRVPRSQISARVAETLEIVGLPGFEQRDINTLSGGESQRVALARSLAPAPYLLMLDEPLGSLDRNLREQLVIDLHHILKQSGQTAIYVTHDQEEAFILADRVVVMRRGKIEQIGKPQEIYQKPASAFVAGFIGFSNQLPAQIQLMDGEPLLSTPIGNFPTTSELRGSVTAFLRADRMQIRDGGDCQINGRVMETSFRGASCQVVVDVNRYLLTINMPCNRNLPTPGEEINLGFDPDEALFVYPEH